MVERDSGGALPALVGVRVLDMSDGVAGAYCTKLLGDAGAEVLKVEPPSGHPVRRWSASGRVGCDGDPDGALFRYLAAGHRSVVVDLTSSDGAGRVLELVRSCDIVVESFAPGALAERGLGAEDLHRANPTLTVVSITPFGQHGPRRADASSDFLLQALAGSMDVHGDADGTPLAVGGRLGEWTIGAYSATGALAARALTARTGVGEHVDVSGLECLALTFVAYPPLFAALPGGTRRKAVFTMVPGVEPCEDGMVGFATITVQQWHDFCALVERPDLVDRTEWNDQKVRQQQIDEVRAEFRPWLREHTCDEIVERAALFRLPCTPVGNGATVTELPHVRERRLFGVDPRGGFPHPRPPFRARSAPVRPIEPSPRLDEHRDAPFGSVPPRAAPPRMAAPGGERPLEGVRIVDLTMFWAGPFATQCLASLGADVVKVEAIQRPDPIRFNVTVPPTADRWYEQGSLHLSVNLDKRAITLDLTNPAGRDILLQVVATADVVVENFTPRVLDQLGLTYDDLRAVRPDIVLLRMPGWGLDGPWRDRPGFASTMEQASGMAWVTGYADGPPLPPGICDPLAGIHGAFAVLAALEHRRGTGQGDAIELSMIDMAVNVAVEQVLEFAVYGHLVERLGNRDTTCAPQGVYQCAGDDRWIAMQIRSDDEWQALCRAIERPDLAADPALAHVDGRRAEHDRLDVQISSWTRTRTLADALAALRDAGAPAEPVVSAYDADRDDQMISRGFWEELDHPVVGVQRYPGWPMRFARRPFRWHRSPAPLLGQHNHQVLAGELGLSTEALDALRDASVIGDRPLGA